MKQNKQYSIFLFAILVAFSSCKIKRKLTVSAPHAVVHETIDVSKKLKNEVKEWLDVPYKFGGIDKTGIDCSALVCTIYKNVYKKDLPRTVMQQYAACHKIAKQKLKEGDLVFFNPKTKQVSHIGIYLDEGKFIHASVSKGVVISDLENTYYKKCFVSGGRL